MAVQDLFGNHIIGFPTRWLNRQFDTLLVQVEKTINGRCEFEMRHEKTRLYGDLVYKFKKLIGRNDFSFQFRKITTRYRLIGYNLNVMRQSACLVFNPITVDKLCCLL